MSTKKATRRALLTSVMALVMCLVMLVGTTFAWFTDSVTSGVNTIKSGNLDMEVTYKTAKGGEQATGTLTDQTKLFDDGALWEPGHVEYAVLTVKNVGSLALKYKLGINVANEVVGKTADNADIKLSEHLRYAVLPGDVTTAAGFDRAALLAAAGEGTPLANTDRTGELYPAAVATGEQKNEETVTLVVWMPTTVGNEANHDGTNVPSIDLGINLVATQKDSEEDSFGKDYDESAGYPVASAAEMKEALTNGGIVSVNKDIKTDNIVDNEAARITISNPTTLNLDAKIISPDDMGNNNINFCALIVDANTTINAGKNGGIDTGTNGGYALNVRKGANLTITGGSYYGGGTAVQVQEGTLTITGGHFAVEAFGEPYGYNFLLNCIDSAYKNGTAKIIVTGGTFVNFNPADNAAEGAGTNFVAAGYKVVSAVQANGDVWYTVVAE